MSKQRDALEKALDTLRGWIGIDEWIWPVTAKETCKKNSLEAIKTIREALAEPEPWTPDDMAYRPGGLSMSAEQEPVAWMIVNEEHGHKLTLHWKPQGHITWKAAPLYTAPPARKPLTIEEITAIVQSMSANTWDVYMLARAIERAHGIGSET